MNPLPTTLQEKFAALFNWQRRKRSEQNLLTLAAVALAVAIALMPLHGYLPIGGLRWLMPVLAALGISPFIFYRRRWRPRDVARALAQIDKELRLDERVSTAWELSTRMDQSAAAQLVIKQTEVGLRAVQPRDLLPRQWTWQSYGALPLVILWFGLLWFDADRADLAQQNIHAPRSLAHKLGEFARDFQEKAKREELPESFKAGQELEKVARKNIEAKSTDEQLKKEVAGMAQKFQTAATSGAEKNSFTAGESEQSLRDLKAELDAARDLLELPDGVKGSQELPQQWTDRLAALPQLKKQLDKEQQAGPGLGQNQLKAFLDRMGQQATGALDRRALIDAQKFLDQMMQAGQGQKSDSQTQMAGRDQPDGSDDGAREKNHSNAPGKEPGKKDGANSLPEFRGGAQTQIKGLLGAGESSGVAFKGKPTTGKSALSEQAVVANYRRQAEQELNSERVPEALKETIRNYFLSLESDGPRK
jgi:hypothetical protein